MWHVAGWLFAAWLVARQDVHQAIVRAEEKSSQSSLVPTVQSGESSASAVTKNVELERGWHFYRRREWGKALSAFERAIVAEPASPLAHVGRAYALNAMGRYDEGTAELWKAIRCNPGDAGLDYDPLAGSTKALSAAALRHGEEQVRKMLKDRPAMAKFISPEDVLWKWAVRKFAGEDLGALVYWDEIEPGWLTSESGLVDGRTVVQAAGKCSDDKFAKSRSFDELWSDVVFELHRIAVSAGDNEEVEPSDLTEHRDELYVDLFKEIDEAGQRTRAFYLKVYLPWLRAKGPVATNPAEWQFYTFPPVGNEQAWLAYWKADPRWELYLIGDELVRAEVDFRNKDFESAREVLTSLLERAEKGSRFQAASAHYWLGCIHYALKEWEPAIDEFTTALRFDASYDVALVERAKTFGRLEQFDKAFADLAAAIRIVPADSNTRMERGHAWYTQEHYDHAIDDYNEAIRLDAKNIDAYYWRGMALHQLGKYSEAIADYVQALRLDSERGEVYVARGDAWQKRGEFDLAILDYSLAIQIDANNANAFYGRGEVEHSQREYAEALKDFREAARLEPEMFHAQNFVAWIRATCADEKLRDGVEAVAAATKACEISEWRVAGTISTLACALAEAGKFDAAVERVDQALKLAESDADTISNLKHWRELFGRNEAFHQKPETEADLGWRYYRRGKLDQALASFSNAQQAEPDSPLPHAGQGCVLISQGSYDQGIDKIWEAIRHNPKDVGLEYDPSPKGALDAKALRHGEEQLQKMLHDRPAMAEHIKPGDALWNWTVRKFAGEDTNSLVYWDAADPKPALAQCIPCGDRLAIRVRANSLAPVAEQPLSFEELWQGAIFELHNLVNTRDCATFGDRIMRNEMTREEYIVAIFKMEEITAQQTRAFYLKSFLPWVRAKGELITEPSRWYCYYFPGLDDRDAMLEQWRADYRWAGYSACYDLTDALREYGEKNYDQARRILRETENPEQNLGFHELADYHYLLGCLYEVASRPQRALVEFTNALACDPDHEAAKLARVKMIAEAGNEKQAIAEFSRLIEAKRDWADAYYYRARVFVATKRHDQAIADCNAAIRLAADRPYPYAERGYAWSLKGDLARADADYSEAVRLDPKNAENLIFRADVREKLAKYPEAIADWRAAIELDPKSADAYRGLGRILSICPEAKLRDSDAAIEAARKACELTDWKDVDSVCVLAKALMRAGKYEEGIEQDKRALFLLQQRLAQLIDKYPRLQAIVAASESDNPPIEANQANQQALSDRCSLAETATQCSKSTCCTRRGWRRGMFGRRRCFQP